MKRVLIVDDEKDITESLKVGLEHRGYKVDAFNDPVKAVDEFVPGAYSTIILDIRMPGMNGFEVFRELKKRDKDARVIFLTAFEMYKEEFRRLFPDIHAQGFLQKPISISLLVSQIGEIEA